MAIDLSNPGRPIEAGVVIMDETEILDIAPIDLLNGVTKDVIQMLPLSDELKAKAPEINFHWITETGAPGKCSSNISIQATDSFETCPPLDIVLLGAYRLTYTASATELAFINKCYSDSSAFITVCAGMLPAQLAGILAGKTATGPRPMIAAFKEQDPRTNWVEKRYVRDGKVWTSGMLLNGLDLMREFLKEYWPELSAPSIDLGGVPIRDVDYPGNDEGLGDMSKTAWEFLSKKGTVE